MSDELTVAQARVSDALVLDIAEKPAAEVLAIISAASRSRRPIRIAGSRGRSMEEQMRFLVAGQGCVSFDDAVRPAERSSAASLSAPRRRWFTWARDRAA